MGALPRGTVSADAVRGAIQFHVRREMYNGTLVSDLIASCEAVLKREIPRAADDFDNLCTVKNALADQMAQEIHDNGVESVEAKNLWHKADILQEEMWKG